jgi:hypothetical protein
MTYHHTCYYINVTGATSGAETIYPRFVSERLFQRFIHTTVTDKYQH